MEDRHKHGMATGKQPGRWQQSLIVFAIGLVLQGVLVGLVWHGRAQAGAAGTATVNATLSVPSTVEVPASGSITVPIVIQIFTDTPMPSPVELRYIGQGSNPSLAFVVNTLTASANTTCVSPPPSSNVIDVTCRNTDLSAMLTATLSISAMVGLQETFFSAGGIILHSGTLFYSGPMTAPNVQMSYTLNQDSNGIRLVVDANSVTISNNGTCSVNLVSGGSEVQCSGTVLPMSETTLSFLATAERSGFFPRLAEEVIGTFHNTTFASDFVRFEVSTDTLTTVITGTAGAPELTLDKQATPNTVQAGESLQFSITVRNTGAAAATACTRSRGNVLNPSISGITPGDSHCLLQFFLGQPSCLDAPPPASDAVAIAAQQTLYEVLVAAMPDYVLVILRQSPLVTPQCNGLNGMLTFHAQGAGIDSMESLGINAWQGTLTNGECNVTYDLFSVLFQQESLTAAVTATVDGRLTAACGGVRAACMWDAEVFDGEAVVVGDALIAGCRNN